LHLDDKLPVVVVRAPDIHHGVFHGNDSGKHLTGLVLDAYHFPVFLEREHAVDKTDAQILVLAEDKLERQIVFWV
jgi:hypothetical protein